eukprot:502595_1
MGCCISPSPAIVMIKVNNPKVETRNWTIVQNETNIPSQQWFKFEFRYQTKNNASGWTDWTYTQIINPNDVIGNNDGVMVTRVKDQASFGFTSGSLSFSVNSLGVLNASCACINGNRIASTYNLIDAQRIKNSTGTVEWIPNYLKNPLGDFQ